MSMHKYYETVEPVCQMPITFLLAEGQYLVIRWLCKPKSYKFLDQCFDKYTPTFQNTHNHSSHSIFLQIYFSDFDYHFNKHNLRWSQRFIDPNLSMINSMIDENQEIKKSLSSIFLTFVLPRDLLPLSTLGLSFIGFLSVTTSKTVGSSLIKLNRRFLSKKSTQFMLNRQLKQGKMACNFAYMKNLLLDHNNGGR